MRDAHLIKRLRDRQTGLTKTSIEADNDEDDDETDVNGAGAGDWRRLQVCGVCGVCGEDWGGVKGDDV
jgi:hypothetical protein